MKIFTKWSFTVFLSLIVLNVIAQDNYFRVSADSIVAGETNDFLINLGYFYSSTDELKIIITPVEYIDHSYCADCNEDTIIITTIEPYDDTIVSVSVDVPLGTYPARYKVEYYDNLTGYNEVLSEWLFIISKPYLTAVPEDQMVCLGSNLLVELKMYDPHHIFLHWYLNDIMIDDFYEKSLSLTEINEDDLGEYTCIVYNEEGSDTVVFTVSRYPSPDIGAPVGPLKKCMGSDLSFYQLPTDDLIFGYNWVIMPGTAATLTPDDNSVSVQWNENFSGDAELFAEMTLEHCPGSNSDTTMIKVVGPAYQPEICIIGLDEQDDKYRIIWNKINDESIIKYIIYRESNVAGQYLKLAEVPAEEFSVFTDESSSPSTISHSYAISYTDTCGNESEKSQIHRTIHLSASIGTSGEHNLSWTPYLGFAFLSYEIYSGTKPEEMTLLQQVNSNITTFSDFDPPSGEVYYQIVVSRDGQCNPGKKSTEYSVSKSNIAEFTTDIENQRYYEHLRIYPNPAQSELNIELERSFSGSCELVDITGRRLSMQSFEGTENVFIDVSDLGSGSYILIFRNEIQVFMGKFIKR